jgi:hypothetical protein
MAVGKQVGEFSYKVTSSTYGETSVQVNLHGTVTGFGTVEGTLTFTGEPGATSGRCSMRAVGFLETARRLGAPARERETVGKHKWRIRASTASPTGTHRRGWS